MRNTIIGIVIGIVFGVLAGTTFVAPKLKEAQVPSSNSETLPPSASASPAVDTEVETLPLPGPERAATSASAQHTLRVVSAYFADTPVVGAMTSQLHANGLLSSADLLHIDIYDPGALVPPADTLNAVRSGTVDGVFMPPGYWSENTPALQFFTSIPFGPPPQEFLAWFYHGGGQDIFQAIMEKKGLKALLCGATPPQSGGWFQKPVRTVDDFQGLNVRALGLGGDVLRRLGVNVSREPSAQAILAGLENKTLDGAIYDLPSIDSALGFQKHAQNYYFPAWHGTATFWTLAFNEQSWERLTQTSRKALNLACEANLAQAFPLADSQQFNALKELGLSGVQIRKWSNKIVQRFESEWKTVIREHTDEDQDMAEAWKSLQRFRRDYAIWRDINRH